MSVKSAAFVSSFVSWDQCPPPRRPEYAFIGRSNVGKSSLINALTGRKNLAKTSSTPGKTQLINYFLIDEAWHLVDLPGYGFARLGHAQRRTLDEMIRGYACHRANLQCMFVLVDSRHAAQQADLDFMAWLTEQGVPLAMVFTKADKQSATRTRQLVAAYKQQMLRTWEALPPTFVTSSLRHEGQDDLLAYIRQLNAAYVPPQP